MPNDTNAVNRFNWTRKICEECKSVFYVRNSWLKLRPHRYCSRKCFHYSRKNPFVDRFFASVGGVSDEHGCIVWIGYRDKYGYGIINSGPPARRTLIASRVSWELFVGPIPEGFCVCHHCDNPPCVRPDHLFVGTRTENNEDKVAKGRLNPPIGEESVAAKLTNEKVRLAREMYASGKMTQLEIAARFGVHGSAVSRAISGETWKHVN